MVDFVETELNWQKAYRLIDTQFPPIDLFEDISDPQDWDIIANAVSKTNPRICDEIGNLRLVPINRRVEGVGSKWSLSPFIQISPHRTGRFNDGTFGVYYAASNFETAVVELIHSKEKFYQKTNEPSGWLATFRELVCEVHGSFVDIRGAGFDDILSPNDYSKSQEFARLARDKNGNGIVYPSVRYDGGECIAAFYPDVLSIPTQGRHIQIHWNGERIDKFRELDNQKNIYEVTTTK